MEKSKDVGRYLGAEFSPGPYGLAVRYAFNKFHKCRYAFKSLIRYNLISDTAWCQVKLRVLGSK